MSSDSGEGPGLPGGSRYQTEVDLSNPNSSQVKIILLAGTGKRVLEIGTATGDTTRVLRQRGCTVVGIEIDPNAAALAAPSCDRMIVGDVEKLDLPALLQGQLFDVVVLGDVLEHLVDPERVLREVRSLLSPGGRVLASIPNVAHASVRLALLLGRFRYTEEGLLDATHLRFFTRASVMELFSRTGYEITEWDRTTGGPFDTEVGLREEELPERLVDAVCDEPDALTYQFIVEARPSEDGSAGKQPELVTEPGSLPLRALWHSTTSDRELVARLEETRRELEERIAQVKEKDEAIADREAQLEKLHTSRSVRFVFAVGRLLRPFRQRRR